MAIWARAALAAPTIISASETVLKKDFMFICVSSI
jgi:hypothetical protein